MHTYTLCCVPMWMSFIRRMSVLKATLKSNLHKLPPGHNFGFEHGTIRGSKPQQKKKHWRPSNDRWWWWSMLWSKHIPTHPPTPHRKLWKQQHNHIWRRRMSTVKFEENGLQHPLSLRHNMFQLRKHTTRRIFANGTTTTIQHGGCKCCETMLRVRENLMMMLMFMQCVASGGQVEQMLDNFSR